MSELIKLNKVLFFYINSTRRLSTLKIICNQKLLANKIGISQKAINGKTTLATAYNDAFKLS